MSENENQDSKQNRASDEESERIIPIEKARGAEKQQNEEEQQEPAPGELNHQEQKALVEAILFAATEPLSSTKLANLVGLESGNTARSLIKELQNEYDEVPRAFNIEEIGGGFQLLSRAEFNPWISKLRTTQEQSSLSQAALETLAIVAYRQPITRADIEDIRGVQSGYILRSLIEKKLVRVTGRGEELGRPLLYGTTSDFLEAFGLSSLRELPDLEELDASSES
ncbi:MAG: SMC-Scp complex subunit ScpB [Planctomycetes bacterium]|nr:SMC-Scp complex subunit ScpB [Planctomycetota bacterium]